MSANDLKTAVFIAYKSILRGHKSTLVLMILILSLSFINMMFISGVMAGIWEGFKVAYQKNLTADITVSPQEKPVAKQFIPNTSELRAQIQTIPGVIATVREYLLASSFSFDKDKNGQYKTMPGSIIAVDPAELSNVLSIQNVMLDGERLLPDDTDKVILSSAIAGGYPGMQHANENLGGARPGDKINITYANGIMRTYTLKGIYDDAFGLNLNYITAKEAESILGVSNSASQIQAKTDLTSMPVEYYQERIQAMVPNLKVQNYNSLLGTAASFGSALTLIANIVSVISIIVAAVTIFVMIYVNALNKRRQIGIFKAIGIKQSIIVNAYIIQALFYTLCGLVIGTVITFFLLKPLLIVYPIPVVGTMNLTLFYTSLKITISIAAFVAAGFLAGRIPARIVAKKDIITAIWG